MRQGIKKSNKCYQSYLAKTSSVSVFCFICNIKFLSNHFWWNFRDVFRTLPNIYDGTLYKNIEQPLAVNYFCKKRHHKCGFKYTSEFMLCEVNVPERYKQWFFFLFLHVLLQGGTGFKVIWMHSHKK